MSKYLDPFKIAINCAEKLYGRINCLIQFDYFPHGEKKIFGECSDSEDNKYESIITINVSKQIDESIDTLIHELAHAIDKSYNKKNAHNKDWKNTYKNILKEYNINIFKLNEKLQD